MRPLKDTSYTADYYLQVADKLEELTRIARKDSVKDNFMVERLKSLVEQIRCDIAQPAE